MDPDARAGKQRGVPRISAWKLAKLDSNEAIKAAAKARASSSVLRPLASQPQGGDYLSSSSLSGRSSPDQQMRSSMYPPSRASRDDSSVSISSPAMTDQRVSTNPIYQPERRTPTTSAENGRATVAWDPEAGRFVSTSASLQYTGGQSIFFGGPIVNTGTRVGRGGQLPVFVPTESDHQHPNQFLSRMP